jgi:hypothetical protein
MCRQCLHVPVHVKFRCQIDTVDATAHSVIPPSLLSVCCFRSVSTQTVLPRVDIGNHSDDSDHEGAAQLLLFLVFVLYATNVCFVCSLRLSISLLSRVTVIHSCTAPSHGPGACTLCLTPSLYSLAFP